jgi:Holliday junction resolvase
MRIAARVDANQATIVKALRQVGMSVLSLAPMGKGCPDLLVADDDSYFLIEVKGPKGKLTDDQVAFIADWRGVVHIARSVDDALQIVGVI